MLIMHNLTFEVLMDILGLSPDVCNFEQKKFISFTPLDISEKGTESSNYYGNRHGNNINVTNFY